LDAIARGKVLKGNQPGERVCRSINETVRLTNLPGDEIMSEQDNREDGTPTNSLTDLPVSAEQAEEAKAGAHAGGGGGGTGKCIVEDISFTTSVAR
jgi:hypothetical protein